MTELTAAALRAPRFGAPGWGKRGYDRAEVDAFLARVATALDAVAAGRMPAVTADQVHSVVFAKPGFGRGRGYDEDEVDRLLESVEGALRTRSGRGGGTGMPNGYSPAS